MKNFKLTVGFFCLVLVLACGNSKDNMKELSSPTDQKQKLEGNKTKSTPQDKQISDSTSNNSPHQPQSTQANPDWNKKIIKTAIINLEVKNYKAFNDLTRERIKRYGGYIAQEQQNQNDYKIEDVVSIKVPVDQFDNLLGEITSGEEKLIEKKITSEDVTTEVVDTKSRIEAKKQVRLRYLDLLKQAKNMEEVLNVQNEINNIQENIEAASGRIEYLSHAAAYSTINLTYFHILNAKAKNSEEISFGDKVWQSFKNGWNWIGDVFVGIISIWPLFLLAFLCWLVYKKLRPSKIQKPTA